MPLDHAEAEASGRWVRDLEFSGNHHLGDAAIRAGLALQQESFLGHHRSRFDPYVLDRDRARIVAHYQRQGYYSARVTDVRLRLVGGDEVDVQFEIEEGAPSRIAALVTRGVPPALAGPSERALAALRRGRIFRYARYETAKQKLVQALRQRGYAHARVDGAARVDRERATVDLQFDVTAGPRVRLGRPRIVGARRVPRSAITARIAWHPGDVYDPEALEETRSRLYELGLFSTVRVSLPRTSRAEVEQVEIAITEAPRHEVRLGVGAQVDQLYWRLHGRAGYLIHGFLDPLTTLTLEARPGYAILRGAGSQSGLATDASASLRRDDLVWPLLRGDATVSYALQQLEAYSTQGPGVGVELGRGFLGQRLRAAASWRFRLLQVFGVDSAIDDTLARDLGLTNPYRLGAFTENLTYDDRDSPVNPRRGAYLSLEVNQGGRFAAGAFRYVRVTPEARGYLPLGSRAVLTARLRAGAAVSGTLPMSERYFSGGASSHRGFPQRQLAPFATGSDHTVPIGGDALFESSLELRYDLVEIWDHMLELGVFADGGDVTLQPGQLDLTHLHWAVGAGLRVRTFLGPLRFDVGYRLDRTGAGNPLPGQRVAYHLTFGEAF